MQKRYSLFILAILLLVVVDTMAWRVSPGGGSARSDQKNPPFEWPGKYDCEQCAGTSSQTTPDPTAVAGGSPASACWDYEIKIAKGDQKNWPAQITVKGPDGQMGLKAQVADSILPHMIEFHYMGLADSSKSAPNFKPNDVLFAMQRREDDVVLRFRAMPTKVADQTVITCTKGK